MPVGTKATVKAVAPRAARRARRAHRAGQHLPPLLPPRHRGRRRPRRSARLHGLGRAASSPIRAASRCSASADTRVLRDDGVEFASVYDGSRHVFTPQRAMRDPGGPGRRHRHVLRRVRAGHAGARPSIAAAVERTTRWAAACKEAHGRRDQLLVGIVQGGVDEELRRRSAAELLDIGFAAYAIGGLSRGGARRGHAGHRRAPGRAAAADKLRYFMGIGDPLGIVEVVRRGVDVFDCVLPTRLARTGTRVHRRWTSEPAQRRLCRRHAAARLRVRLLLLPTLHARLPAPPGQPEGDPRRRAAESTQPARSGKIGRRGPREHQRGPVRCVRRRYPRAVRRGRINNLMNSPILLVYDRALRRRLLLPGRAPPAASAARAPGDGLHAQEGRRDRHHRGHVRHGPQDRRPTGSNSRSPTARGSGS